MKLRPKARLGEVLERTGETIEPQADTEYREITVRLWGNGVIERGRVLGASLAGRRFVARGGQFLASRIDARNGAMGLVPGSLDGALVTNDFPLFKLRRERLDPAFLGWLCRTAGFVELCLRASEGTTNRVRLKEERFLGLEMPLPPLAEQRRVVARIEELAAQIHEARTLRQQAAEEANALLTSYRRTAFGEGPTDDWIPMSDYVASIENGKSPATDGRPSAPDEWGVLKVGAVSFGVFNERENKALPISYAVPPALEVRCGDLIMGRANTLELVGACALVRKTRPKLMLSDKTFRFGFHRPQKVSPEYMEQVLKSPQLRQQIERAASGTSPTMKNISKEKVLALLLPPLTPNEQHRIVAELDALQAQVDALKRLQAETAVELDALVPAILDRAFKGEL
jgi:type I restriction enzyme, S subunit